MKFYPLMSADRKSLLKVHNHISGKTLNEEIQTALGIGGRLPFDALVEQLEHKSPRERRQYYAANKRIFGGD